MVLDLLSSPTGLVVVLVTAGLLLGIYEYRSFIMLKVMQRASCLTPPSKIMFSLHTRTCICKHGQGLKTVIKYDTM
jgi:hypothetical protein